MSDKVNLVVTSKVKAVIKEAGLLCSATYIGAISDKVRELTLQAVENAKNSKRKTVKDTDL
ncbi:MAG: hypothetical protein KAS64_03475 [Spirochaetes bacterium]|nr:hypothetical protein [Spirochaetota bacterium]